jgi:hypothetical protein
VVRGGAGWACLLLAAGCWLLRGGRAPRVAGWLLLRTEHWVSGCCCSRQGVRRDIYLFFLLGRSLQQLDQHAPVLLKF